MTIATTVNNNDVGMTMRVFAAIDKYGRTTTSPQNCNVLIRLLTSFYGTHCITDSNGNVQKDLWNEGTKHKHVKYYYQNGEECKL